MLAGAKTKIIIIIVIITTTTTTIITTITSITITTITTTTIIIIIIIRIITIIIIRGDGKRPDGLTLVPWQNERSLTWDVTVVNTLASSYTPTTSVTSCGAAEAAATRKRAKYADIIQSHLFAPIAIETVGPINMDGQRFLDSLGERISSVSGDPIEITFLYQRLSVLIQILNSVAFRGTHHPETVTEG